MTGNYIALCNSNGSDSNNIQYCYNGCENGECCISHDSYSCFDGHVYWYDSCGSKEEIKENCDSYGCSNEECNSPSSYCGDGNCDSDEEPGECIDDCGDDYWEIDPSLYKGSVSSSASLSCSSTSTNYWHYGISGGKPYWVWASNCGVPSTSSPSSYTTGFNARYSISIKKAGYYKISTWIPDTVQACNTSSEIYSPEVHYILERVGSSNQREDKSQQGSIGGPLVIFSNIYLNVGTQVLWFYDDAWGGNECRGSNSNTVNRVYADTLYIRYLD